MRSYFIICKRENAVEEYRIGFRDDKDPLNEIDIDTDIEPSKSYGAISRIVDALNSRENQQRLL